MPASASQPPWVTPAHRDDPWITEIDLPYVEPQHLTQPRATSTGHFATRHTDAQAKAIAKLTATGVGPREIARRLNLPYGSVQRAYARAKAAR